MAMCPHNSVQQYTEICLNCGRNVYESNEEYLKYLKEEKLKIDYNARQKVICAEIEALEIELGIKHPGNTPKLPADDC